MIRLLLLLAALLAAPVGAQAQTRPTAEEQQQVGWVTERGRLLFEIDRAAWVTTDDMRERLSRDAQAAVRGWTVERDSAGYVVVYYMLGEEEVRRALYRGRVENRRVVSRETFPPGSGPELTPMQRRIADAFNLVTQMDARICADTRPNIAVIPPDSLEAPMDVYVLTPQIRAGTYPLGGHNRATFSAAGTLLSQRAFTNSCLDMTRNDRAAAMGVSHLLDPIPTEIHVFMSIWIGLPIFVGTGQPQRVWEVTGERIDLVEEPAAPGS